MFSMVEVKEKKAWVNFPGFGKVAPTGVKRNKKNDKSENLGLSGKGL